MDIRLQQLSYSSRLLLNSCPRKYQLKKLDVTPKLVEDMDSEITFEFGKLVGYGIQLAFMGIDRPNIILACFDFWKLDLLVVSSKHKKSFFHALIAIDKFISMREQGFLAGLRVLSYQGKPAAELSFLIDFNEGFNERGFLDLVLEHEETGEIFTVEIKTDSSKQDINPIKYENSSQALGYSIVLDHIKPGLVSYKVLYLIYLTEKLEYTMFQFTKTLAQKAEWLSSISLDIAKIKLYEQAKHWPKHGQSCFSYFKPCIYYQICGMSDKALIRPLTKAREAEVLKDNEELYTIKANILDLIDSQLDRNEIKVLT